MTNDPAPDGRLAAANQTLAPSSDNEYERLERRDRRVIGAGELSDSEIALIAGPRFRVSMLNWMRKSKTDNRKLALLTVLTAQSSAAGLIVTLSPQPQASVWLGLRNTNFEARRVSS